MVMMMVARVRCHARKDRDVSGQHTRHAAGANACSVRIGQGHVTVRRARRAPQVVMMMCRVRRVRGVMAVVARSGGAVMMVNFYVRRIPPARNGAGPTLAHRSSGRGRRRRRDRRGDGRNIVAYTRCVIVHGAHRVSQDIRIARA